MPRLNLFAPLCLCGHIYSEHSDLPKDYWGFNRVPVYCDADDRVFCVCRGFRMDNLKYLEQLSGQ